MIEGKDLTNRGPEPRGAEAVRADLRRVAAKPPEAPPAPEGRPLAQRIERARGVLPSGEAVHCGHCFGMGRDAAIRAFEKD